MAGASVNICAMDPDDLFARRSDDPLQAVIRQDLDPLSVEELGERIETLEGEIARCRARIEKAQNHRASADSLFKR